MKEQEKNKKQKRTWRELNPHINVLQARGLKDNASPIGQQVLVCCEPHFSFALFQTASCEFQPYAFRIPAAVAADER